LSARVVLLAPVVAAGALGRATRLGDALSAALGGGVPPGAVRECLLMLALFAGFPRTLDAFAAYRRVHGGPSTPEAGLADDVGERRETFRVRGRDLFERVYGPDSERVMERLLELDPELPHWIVEDAYGRVLARPGLSAAERECLAVVALCALRLRNQLAGHVRGALLCGATPDEIRACLAAADLPEDEIAAARDALDRATEVDGAPPAGPGRPTPS
jgi:4-carboxymuconolactone decarboxylase